MNSRIYKAIVWFWVLAVCAGLPVLAKAPKDRERVELDIPIFAGGYGMKFFEESAREFEKLRPDVKVNIYGDPRINEMVRIRVMEGSFPDATQSSLHWPNLIAANKVLDLAPYLDKPNWEGDAKWRDSFLPGSLERWQEGPHQWAMPFPYATFQIFYNKKMFREKGWQVPRTWDEMFALCDKIQKSGVEPFAFPGVYMGYADMIRNGAHYNLVGPEEYRRHNLMTKGTRSDPRYKRAAQVVQTLSTKYFQKGWEGMTHTQAQLQFFRGQTAMMANGSWLVSEMQGKIPEGFELGAMNFPVFKDGIGDPSAMQVGSEYYYVFASTRHRSQTIDFLRFLTSRARAAAFSKMQDTPTAVRGVPADVYSPLMRDLAEMIGKSKESYGDPPGTAASFPEMHLPETDARSWLLTGKMTPEEYGDFLEAAAERARASKLQPDKVHVRHGFAGTVLLLIMGWMVVYSLASRLRRRPTPSVVESGPRMRFLNILLFVGPAMLLYLIFILKPSVESFGWAFTNWDGITDRKYVGLLHFKRLLFESDVFWTALRNNLFIMFVPALFVIPISLFFATLISRGVWGANVFRVCFLFPNILGAIAVTLIWLNAYNPQGGLVNGAIAGFGHWLQSIGLQGIGGWFAGFEHFAWLSEDHLYWALIPMTIWGACGFNMILYLAAMESVDESLYEAAEIDGASPVQQFFKITLPMIWDVLIISAVFMVIGGLKAFESIWLLTSQQPTSSLHVIGTLMVSTMFNDFRIGQATAIAVVMFMLVFFGTIATMRLMRRESVHE